MVTYQYLRWAISKRRGSSEYFQVAEFRLVYTGSNVAWNASAVATNPGGEPGAFGTTEVAQNVLDGNTATKWGNAWFAVDGTVGQAVLEINNTVPVTFDAYQYATANDNENRDPVSWKLYGSNDYVTWNLLDEVTDASITVSRQTYTQQFPVAFVSQSFAKVYRYAEPIDAYTDVTLLASRTTGSSTITFAGPQVY